MPATTKTVSESYLMGIREARGFMKSALARGDYDCPLQLAREALASVELTKGQGFTGELRDYFRGERDFWRNQIAKAKAS